MTAAIVSSTSRISPAHANGKACLLNLLIISQDRSLGHVYIDAASALGYSAAIAANGEQALHLIDSEKIDALVFDLHPPVASGLEILQDIMGRHPEIEVVATGTSGAAEFAVQVMKAGARDYLPKPFTLEQLGLMLDGIAVRCRYKTESRQRCEGLKNNQGFAGMIGRTPEMDKLYRLISKASQSSHPVLILGESGTGKEMVAHAIHYAGPLRDKPFIPVDCGSLVPSLIESELFGHVKGAFTGAAQSKDGLLTIAEGGTIFLDEIGELAPDLQAKLLRVLQEKEIRPVGGTKAIPVNVRVVAATNPDLEQAVAQGAFRLDLFYRLNVLSLRVPPLRERRQDVPLLAAKLLEQCSRSSGRNRLLSDEAVRCLIAHDWPGNVRELENCLERCCAMSSGPIISQLRPSKLCFRTTEAVMCRKRKRSRCATERDRKTHNPRNH
jgi:DNA-binding NtrC family response regulator